MSSTSRWRSPPGYTAGPASIARRQAQPQRSPASGAGSLTDAWRRSTDRAFRRSSLGLAGLDYVIGLLGCITQESGLRLLDFHRPTALDIGQHCPDISIVEHLREPWHVALIVRTDDAGRSPLGDLEQQVIAVMPGVTGRIMGWGKQRPVGVPSPPIRLSFKVCTVTGGTMRLVDNSAASYQL